MQGLPVSSSAATEWSLLATLTNLTGLALSLSSTTVKTSSHFVSTVPTIASFFNFPLQSIPTARCSVHVT